MTPSTTAVSKSSIGKCKDCSATDPYEFKALDYLPNWISAGFWFDCKAGDLLHAGICCVCMKKKGTRKDLDTYGMCTSCLPGFVGYPDFPRAPFVLYRWPPGAWPDLNAPTDLL